MVAGGRAWSRGRRGGAALAFFSGPSRCSGPGSRAAVPGEGSVGRREAGMGPDNNPDTMTDDMTEGMTESMADTMTDTSREWTSA